MTSIKDIFKNIPSFIAGMLVTLVPMLALSIGHLGIRDSHNLTFKECFIGDDEYLYFHIVKVPCTFYGMEDVAYIKVDPDQTGIVVDTNINYRATLSIQTSFKYKIFPSYGFITADKVTILANSEKVAQEFSTYINKSVVESTSAQIIK